MATWAMFTTAIRERMLLPRQQWAASSMLLSSPQQSQLVAAAVMFPREKRRCVRSQFTDWEQTHLAEQRQQPLLPLLLQLSQLTHQRQPLPIHPRLLLRQAIH